MLEKICIHLYNLSLINLFHYKIIVRLGDTGCYYRKQALHVHVLYTSSINVTCYVFTSVLLYSMYYNDDLTAVHACACCQLQVAYTACIITIIMN